MNDPAVARHLLIFVAAVGVLVSQLLMKHGVARGDPISVVNLGQLIALIQRILQTPTLLFGYILSFATGLVWLAILSRTNLSYAVPLMTAIYFILLLLTSALVLREAVNLGHWIGTLLIIAGIFLIARSG